MYNRSRNITNIVYVQYNIYIYVHVFQYDLSYFHMNFYICLSLSYAIINPSSTHPLSWAPGFWVDRVDSS